MSINRKRGSIALARSLCYQINGAADDSDDISAGGGYGSVDIAEILSAEVVRLQEALKLALDALENHTAIKHPQQIHYRDKAITAIKEALAQPHERTFKEFDEWICDDPHYHNWVKEREDRLKPELDALQVLANENQRMAKVIAELDAKRKWVGLTDDEREEIALEVPMDAVCITEAKLKELNT